MGGRTRILYLISSLGQGGAERHLIDLARKLDPTRFEYDVCVLRDQVHFRGELPEGQPRYRLRSRIWPWPPAFARLVAAVRDAQPHILHTYLNDGNLWGRLATLGAKRRPRILTSVHLDDMSAGYRVVERLLASRVDRIVAHSRSIAQMLTARVGVASDRVVVIPNGVDPKRHQLASDEARSAARTKYGLGPADFVAVMAARISPQKNQTIVMQALGQLKAEGALPAELTLLLAGRVSSHAYAREVTRLIAKYDLGRVVRVLGPVREMSELYATADVMLMPSRTEASPIAALEALSSGIPVLISAAANTDDVLIDGEHGWQIDEPSPSSVAAALRTILAQPPEERRRMSARARAHVVARFTVDRVAADFMRLYDNLSPPAAAAAAG